MLLPPKKVRFSRVPPSPNLFPLAYSFHLSDRSEYCRLVNKFLGQRSQPLSGAVCRAAAGIIPLQVSSSLLSQLSSSSRRTDRQAERRLGGCGPRTSTILAFWATAESMSAQRDGRISLLLASLFHPYPLVDFSPPSLTTPLQYQTHVKFWIPLLISLGCVG